MEFLEFVTIYIDQEYPIGVTYLDFQKAIDKVPHKRLMMNINAMGITGDVLIGLKIGLMIESRELFFCGVILNG